MQATVGDLNPRLIREFLEALVNAIYHRSYEIREPVEVRITREDLVILSLTKRWNIRLIWA